MKKILQTITILLIINQLSIAQSVTIDPKNTGNTPNIIDIKSDKAGIVVPRMTTTQKNAIANKIEGMMVYDIDLHQFSYWINAAGVLGYWQNFGTIPYQPASVWNNTGNDINNTNAGNVGIGTSSPTQKIDIAGKIKIGNDAQTAAEGTIRYNSSNKYFEGYDGTNWTAFNAVATLPQTAIVMSETKTNANLVNAGYSLNGVANFQFNQYSTDAYGWIKQLNATNAPLGRANHTAVWTGTKMIIWGGESFASYFNDGKIYNSSSDTWSSMSTSFLAARRKHAAVWTGTKMIIWGGMTSLGTFFDNGASYDLSTDTWSTISTSNAPSARGGFSTVWIGNKMIIWGGYSGIGGYNVDGKVYDPSNNTWTSISLTNAPEGRINHSTIWTGSKMIVFGGQTTNAAATNSGSIYDPATNTWVAMSTVGGPSLGLYAHSAIWTGSKMIVFGGFNNNGTLTNACFSYNPSNDTWAVLSSTNIPSPRYGHTAIWTGSKMIIFGGVNANNIELNDGGIYNPTTDTWDNDPITLSGYNYSNHTAIWTGEDMLIFGLSPGHLLKKDFKSPTTKPMYLYQKN